MSQCRDAMPKAIIKHKILIRKRNKICNVICIKFQQQKKKETVRFVFQHLFSYTLLKSCLLFSYTIKPSMIFNRKIQLGKLHNRKLTLFPLFFFKKQHTDSQ